MSINDLQQQRKHVKKVSRSTRRWRRVHHYLGLCIAMFLFLSALTGIILGWKKDVVLLQPVTHKGKAVNLGEWITLEELKINSSRALNEKAKGDYEIDRIDIRPDKGIAKIIFKPGYWEVQLDGSTGQVLSVEKRYSDLVEQIHDGSIISDGFKLFSMNILGIGILVMIISGLCLWYAPKKIRRLKN